MADHFNFYVPDRQGELVRSVCQQTQLSISELFRRLIDQGLTRDRVNELVPASSGRIAVEV